MNWLLLTIGVLLTIVLAGLLLKRLLPRLSRVLLCLALLLALAVGSGTAVCWSVPDTPQPKPDYALLLGCALEDGQATDELIRRCRTALEWMEQNPGFLLVVSGGDGAGHGITEARVMADWLLANGADPARVLPEDQALDTRQNLLYSKTMVHNLEQETDTVLLITSEYHQTRACFLARQNGQTPLTLSCATPFPDHLQAAVREVYAFIKAVLEIL